VYRKGKEYNSCAGTGKIIAGEVFYQKGNIQETEFSGVDAMGISVNNCEAIGYMLSTKNADDTMLEKIFLY
jgi:hypothetical protein